MQKYLNAWLKKLIATATLSLLLIAPAAQAFTVGGDVPDITASSATPNPYDPNTDGMLNISWTLQSAPAVIQVYIYDGSNIVRTLSGGTYYQTGTNYLPWDGKLGGAIAPAKVYTYRIRAYNNYGEDTVTGPINVSYSGGTGTAPNVYGDSVSDYEIDPTNNETTTLSYSLNTTANVTVAVKQGSSTVETLQSSTSKSAGSYNMVIDAKYSNNTNYAEGSYTYEVYANNSYGSDTESGSFVVDYAGGSGGTAPNVYNDGVSDSEIDPTNNETTTLSYSLNTTANVTVKVKQGSTTVETLQSSTSESAGTHTEVIDAKYSNGNEYAEGTYTYEVYAVNNDGNDTETGSFVVDYNGGGSGTAPNVYNDGLSDTDIDPTNNETTTLSYSLNTTADVTVKVKQGSSTVETLQSSTSESAGTHTEVIDAKYSNGNEYAEGTYTYEVYATNNDGSDTETGSFVVDYEGGGSGNAPNVYNDSLSDDDIDPTNNETTTLTYSLDTTADVTVKVKQGSSTVETLQSSTSKSAGTYNVVIDATYSNGNEYDEGTYTYEVYATNNDGSDTETGSFVVDYEGGGSGNNPPNVSNDYASPSTFDPDEENTRVYFTLDKTADVTVEILEDGDVIRTLLDDVSTGAGTYSITWNGKDSSGDDVDEDTYEYRIYAENSGGEDTEKGDIEVDYDGGGSSSDVNITNDRATPNPFDPEEENLKIYYTLNRDADVTVEILEDGDVIRTLLDDVARYDGSNSVTWNGKDKYGDEVDDGNYEYKIRAYASGHGSDTEKGDIEADRDGGSSSSNNLISDVDVKNDIFDPSENEESEICFDILKNDTEITIEVLDGNRVIETLVDEKEYDKRNDLCIEWDGDDEDGDMVDDDVYEFRIRAEQGNDVEVEYAYVEVDTDGRIIGFPNDNDYCGGFYDVPKDSPFCRAIELMNYRGIFGGYPDGSFRPYNDINRAEAVKVMLLALEKNILSDDNTNLGYWDVQKRAWYMRYLRTAQREGIAEGYPDGAFRPGHTINRVELLKVFLESTDINVPHCNYTPYPDTVNNYTNRWYIDYVCFAKAYGLMSADSEGNFNPADAMSRADVAQLFYNFEKRGLFAGYNNDYYDYYYDNFDNNYYYTPGYTWGYTY